MAVMPCSTSNMNVLQPLPYHPATSSSLTASSNLEMLYNASLAQGHLPVHHHDSSNFSSPVHNPRQPQQEVHHQATGHINTEICRFCGEDLPTDTLSVVAHFNNHYRQFSLGAIHSSINHSSSNVSSLDTRMHSSQFDNIPNATSTLNENSSINDSNENLVSSSNMNSNSQLNTASNFQYSYSPQSEPSNLTLSSESGNHMKSTDNSNSHTLELSNSGNSCIVPPSHNSTNVHTIAGGSESQTISTDCSETANKAMSLQGNIQSCSNNGVGLSNSNSSNLGIGNNRCSPLNLTGRSKLVSSPTVPLVSLANVNNALQQSCPVNNIQHININQHSTGLPAANSHMSSCNQQLFLPNYTFPSTYFGSNYNFNVSPHTSADLPSCRMQQQQQYSQNNVENNTTHLAAATQSVLSSSHNLRQVHQQASEHGHQQHSPEHCVEQQQNRPSIIATPAANCNSNSGNEEVAIDDNRSCSGIQVNTCSNFEPSPLNIMARCPPSNAAAPHQPMQSANDLDEETSHVKDAYAKNESISGAFQYVCNLCKSYFYNKVLYQSHLLLHVGQNKCDTSKPFSEDAREIKEQYLHHTQASENKSPIKCPSYESAKPYKCSICNTEFSVKEELHEHFKEHEASKPYHCDACGLGVSNKRALKRHKLIHTGHKPNKCETCGKAFLQKHDLIRHKNIHLRPKYSTCSECKRTFTAISSFKTHKCKGAKEIKPFLCHICGDGCANRLAWSYHMWKHTKNPMFVPFQEDVPSDISITK